jgi:hypothetical protein
MPLDLKKFLQKMLAELEDEERNDLLLELKDKKLTSNELVEAIRDLPENERAAVREAFISAAETEGGPKERKQADKLEADAEKEEENSGIVVEGEKEEKSKKKTRTGRKHGRAYDWYVDDKGRVKVTDVAQVYSGEDEPDEVEMWDGENEEEEEEGIEEE